MPRHVGSCAINAVHCVMARTKTRSKNSSSGVTRSSWRSTAGRCGERVRAAVVMRSSCPMTETGPHQLLFYDYVENVVERRAPHRERHLAYARRFKDEGQIVMAGAAGDPPPAAVFVFRGDAAPAAEAFAREDPYVREGLVTSWRVEPWNVVL